MNKKRLGNYVLFGGLAVLLLVVAALLYWAMHTRAGALSIMILKALDIMNAYVVASVVVIAGTATIIYAVSRLSSGFPENEDKDDDKNKDEN